MLDDIRFQKEQAKWNDDKKRRHEVARAIDYYKNRYRPYLNDEIEYCFKNSYEDIQPFRDHIPLTQQVINQISMLFEEPPTIETDSESLNERFEELKETAQFIPIIQKVNKYVNLTKKVGVKPYFWEGNVYLDILTGDRLFIEQNEENPTKADAVWVQVDIYSNTPNRADKVNVYIRWTPDTYQKIHINTENGRIVEKEKEERNYYEEIPIVWFTDDIEDDNFWFEHEYTLVDKNIIFDVDLTGLRFASALQSYSTLVLEGFDQTKNLKMGVHRPIKIPLNDSQEPGGKAYYITPGTDLNEVYDYIDKRIVHFVNGLGLNAKSFRADNSSFTSGYHLRLSKLDVIKKNMGDRAYYTKPIKDLCKMMMKCYTIFNASKRFPEDVEINLDYGEIKFDENPMEKVQVNVIKLSNNLTSRARILMGENPDLSLEEAKELAAEIKAENEDVSIGAGLENIPTEAENE